MSGVIQRDTSIPHVSRGIIPDDPVDYKYKHFSFEKSIVVLLHQWQLWPRFDTDSKGQQVAHETTLWHNNAGLKFKLVDLINSVGLYDVFKDYLGELHR